MADTLSQQKYFLCKKGVAAYDNLTQSRHVTLKNLWEIGNHTVRKMVGDLSGKSVLDVGCGSGRLIETLYQWGAKEVTGVDISEEMIGIARRNSRPETEFYITDICKLGVVGEFDVAVSCLVLMYLNSLEKFSQGIEAVYDNLKPGGVFSAWLACFHDGLPFEGQVPQDVSCDTKWVRETKTEFDRVTVTCKDDGNPLVKMEVFNLNLDTVRRVMQNAGFVNVTMQQLDGTPETNQIVPIDKFREHFQFFWVFRCEKPLLIQDE